MDLLLAAALLSLSADSPRPAEDLAGEWDFQGSCPATQIRYRGRLTISGSGPSYDLVWSADGARLFGRGLVDRDHMAVEFHAAGDRGGLLHMRRRGGEWRGRWAYYGDAATCTETWTRR